MTVRDERAAVLRRWHRDMVRTEGRCRCTQP